MAVHRIPLFDIWQQKYAGAILTVFIAGTTTKATLFSDEALTVSAVNPQTLDSQTIGDYTFGKLAVPLYTASAFTLDIDSTDQTGIFRPPITALATENASKVVVTALGGAKARDLDTIVAREVYVEDHGVFLPTSDAGASASTNNATLTTALGIAAANSGGDVIIPADTYTITTVTVAAGCRIVGQGIDATILQSQTADKIVTFSGDKAGLRKMTLDGVTLVAGSTGVYSKANDRSHFDEVMVKRFETGLHCRGGRAAEWETLYISNCVTGAKLHGDLDVSGGSDGDEFRNNEWAGGVVDLCTTTGVDLSFEDKKCWHNTLRDVGFESNTGTALKINGARHSKFPGCWWTANTTDLAVDDDDDTDNATINTVVGLHFFGGSMSGGAATFTGKCQDVILDGMELSDVDFTLTLPENNIVVRDCIEDSLVTLSGDGTKWTRCRTMKADPPGSSGQTTDATVTKAWSIALDPGQRASIRAVVVANQRDGTGRAQYHIGHAVHRPGSTLDYDAQTANFTLGKVLTGGTSGATALIIADSDSGATGTLTLREISGTFQNNETITDSVTGSATANGTVTNIDVALLGSTVSIMAAVESDTAWACDFAINAGEVEIQVTGEASKTIDWVVHAEVVTN